jgi:hypothetical protein
MEVATKKRAGRKRYSQPKGRCSTDGMVMLRDQVNATDMTVEDFALEMNVPKSNLYYWMKNGAFYQEGEGRRRIVLPKVVAEVSL